MMYGSFAGSISITTLEATWNMPVSSILCIAFVMRISRMKICTSLQRISTITPAEKTLTMMEKEAKRNAFKALCTIWQEFAEALFSSRNDKRGGLPPPESHKRQCGHGILVKPVTVASPKQPIAIQNCRLPLWMCQTDLVETATRRRGERRAAQAGTDQVP